MAPQALRRRRAAAQLLEPEEGARGRWRSSGRCSPSKPQDLRAARLALRARSAHAQRRRGRRGADS
jgi:hypothetical protein